MNSDEDKKQQKNLNNFFSILQTRSSDWQVIKDGILSVENEAFEEALRYTEADFDSFLLENTFNYIAKDEEEIIGYLMSCPIENDEGYSDDLHFGEHDTLHLESTGLKSNYRGKGIGQALFVRWLEDAKKNGYSRAVMDATSEPMVGLGLKYGFKKIKFYPKWQGDRTSWYMEKEF